MKKKCEKCGKMRNMDYEYEDPDDKFCIFCEKDNMPKKDKQKGRGNKGDYERC